MFNTMNTKNTNKEYVKIKLLKDNVIAESEKSVLFRFENDSKLEESVYFWINKKAIFYSPYSNILDVSLIEDANFKYGVYKEGNKDWKKPDNQVTAKVLKEAIINSCKKIKLINLK